MNLIKSGPKTVKALEQAGKRVKGAAQESLSNIARSTSGPAGPKAIGLSAASAVAEVAPFSPSEFGEAAFGEVLPGLVFRGIDAIPVLRQILPEAQMNRFLKLPRGLSEKRLEKGAETIGKEFLESGEFNPQSLGSLPSSDKKQIFNKSRFVISKFANEIQKKISKIGGQLIDKSVLGRNEMIDSVSTKLVQMKEAFGLDPEDVNLLTEIVASPKITVNQLNKFRQLIGKEVGKRFTREIDDLPEFTQAQVELFGNARNALSKIAPDVSGLLNRQHLAFEIKAAVKPEAALGYGKIPFSIPRAIIEPIISSPKAAEILRSLSKARGIGGSIRSVGGLGDKK